MTSVLCLTWVVLISLIYRCSCSPLPPMALAMNIPKYSPQTDGYYGSSQFNDNEIEDNFYPLDKRMSNYVRFGRAGGELMMPKYELSDKDRFDLAKRASRYSYGKGLIDPVRFGRSTDHQLSDQKSSSLETNPKKENTRHSRSAPAYAASMIYSPKHTSENLPYSAENEESYYVDTDNLKNMPNKKAYPFLRFGRDPMDYNFLRFGKRSGERYYNHGRNYIRLG